MACSDIRAWSRTLKVPVKNIILSMMSVRLTKTRTKYEDTYLPTLVSQTEWLCLDTYKVRVLRWKCRRTNLYTHQLASVPQQFNVSEWLLSLCTSCIGEDTFAKAKYHCLDLRCHGVAILARSKAAAGACLHAVPAA